MSPPPAIGEAATSHGVQLGQPAPVHVRIGSLAPLLRPREWSRMRFLVDALVLSLAATASLFPDASIRSVAINRVLAAVFPIAVLAILYARSAPDDRLPGSLLDTALNVLGVVSLCAMLLIAVDVMAGTAQPMGLSLRLWIFSVAYLGIERCVLLSIRRQAVRSESLATPTLIVGAGAVGDHLVRRLRSDPSYGLRPVGFLDNDPLPRALVEPALPVPVLGGPDELASAVAQTGARQVILAFSNEPDSVLIEIVKECERLGVDVALVPRLYEAINVRSALAHVGGLPLVSLRPTDTRGWPFAVKHGIDRAFAALALLAFAPLMIGIALAVKLSSPGPILFRQRRVGRNGRAFDLLKFRTMREDVAGGVFTLVPGSAPGGVEGTDRRTGVGQRLRRLSLDELPQLINVVRGDMSLVGPRPERPAYVQLFSAEIAGYEDRHRVRSGITGWAQVNGLRGQTSIADRVEWDNWYIQNWSLWLDFRIIALTVAEILRARG